MSSFSILDLDAFSLRLLSILPQKFHFPNVAELCPMWLLIGAGFGCNTADAAVFDVQERSRGSVWLLMVVSVVMIA